MTPAQFEALASVAWPTPSGRPKAEMGTTADLLMMAAHQ